MSTDHRKPLVAFVLLALAAAVVVGMGRADAVAGRLFESVGSASIRVHGAVDAPRNATGASASFDALVAESRVNPGPDGRRGIVGAVSSVGARLAEPVSRGADRHALGSFRHHRDARRPEGARRHDAAGSSAPAVREARQTQRSEEKAHEAAREQEEGQDKAERKAARHAPRERRHSTKAHSAGSRASQLHLAQIR